MKAPFEETDEEIEIGQIEPWHIDRWRAEGDGLNIADVCDSLGQEVYEYVSAVQSSLVLGSRE